MASRQASLYIFAYTLPILLFSGSAKAAITLIACRDYLHNDLPAEAWTIDYDLQLLSLAIPVYATGSNPPESPPPYFVRIYGTQDSESVLTVVENFANNTGSPLTGCIIELSTTLGTESEIVPGTVHATGSAQLRRENISELELAWSEPIPAGGFFTIQFDVVNFLVSDDWVAFNLNHTVVPEPATITVLALGGLLAMRLRTIA